MATTAQRTFARTLYAEASVKEAAEAFADFAKIELAEGEDGWTLTLQDVDEDFAPEVLASELANYVLASTIDRRRS